MPLLETVVAATKPWTDWYSHSKPVQAGVTWLHLSALLVAGGFALASDRAALRALRGTLEQRRHVLVEFAAIHRPVLAGLALAVTTGVLMTLGDPNTFLTSAVYWSKMGLLALLLLNGWGLTRAERNLARDPSPANRAWRRFTLGAVASITLWLGTTLAGVLLTTI